MSGVRSLSSGCSRAFRIKAALICLIAVFAAIYNLSLKRELHTDEYVAYVIANHTGEPASMFSPESMHYYEEPGEPYLKDMTVATGEGFRLGQVCRNDATDTNPPLHYILLNAVSSFFPGQFSYWFGGSINIAFFGLCAIMLIRLALMLGMKEPLALLSSLVFSLMPASLEIVQFIRMYTMCMFFCIWLACGLVGCVKSERFTWKTGLGLALPTIGGALTHYYFLLFAAFGAICTGVYLLYSKRFKETGFFALSFAAAAGVTLAVFPQMLAQMFGGWLTDTSVVNLSQTSDMLSRLKAYYFVINSRIFGGYLPEFALACALAAFLAVFTLKGAIKKYAASIRKHLPFIVCIALPSLLYFFLVTKISFFTNTRYMCLIYPFIVLGAVGLLGALISLGCGANRLPIGIVSLLCVISILAGIRAYPAQIREYSGADASKIFAVNEYKELDVLCVYDTNWSAETTYNLNKDMKGLVFASPEEIERASEVLEVGAEGLIVELRSTFDKDEMLLKLLEVYPHLNAAVHIASDYFYDIYLLR